MAGTSELELYIWASVLPIARSTGAGMSKRASPMSDAWEPFLSLHMVSLHG